MTRAEVGTRLSFFLDPTNWPLFYHTGRHMQLQQLAGVGERALRHLLVPSLPVDFDARYERRVPADPPASPDPVRANTGTLRNSLDAERNTRYCDRAREVAEGRVTFLNRTVRVADGDAPAWFDPAFSALPELWPVKLWAFEFCTWPVLGAETSADLPGVHRTLRRWIRDWAASSATDIGTSKYLRRAWTPYSVSLRLVNWCRYYAWCARESQPSFLRTLRRLIFKNALFLANHVEYDVGGNHLVENGAALVTAGVLFSETSEGRRWLDSGLDILASAGQQFLPDGGHFEHSPMYHTLVLTRYLTVLDLLDGAGEPRPAALVETARRATGFLQAIRPPDGRIPLLNDAVHGEAMGLENCLAYASALGISPDQSGRNSLPDSGYYWLGNGSNRLLVDGGRFGPPHLPAHSHNDCLSILVWVDGTRLLTDTGTFEYDPTPTRTYARSVRAHNTVQVGDMEPVDIGGRYLAGRRTTPEVRYRQTDDYSVFDGRYRKRTFRGSGYTHRRRIYGADDWWLVRDTIESDGSESVRSRLHVHPQATVERQDDGGFELRVESEALAYVLPVDYDDVTRTTTSYFPEFGREQRRPSLTFETTTANGAANASLLLSTESYTPADCDRLEGLVTGE